MQNNKLVLQQNMAAVPGGISVQYKLLLLSSFAFVSLLSGCSGGGGGGGGGGEAISANANAEGMPSTPAPAPPANESAAGIWRGSVTSQSGATFPSTGLVNEAGEVRLITAGSTQISGTIDVVGTAFTAGLRSYAPPGVFFTVSPPINGTANGTINKTSALLGNINLLDGTTYNLTFSYDPLYERDSSLAAISGNYTKSDGAGYTVTYSIDAAGVFTGNDTNGCVLNGSVELMNTDFNMYKVTANATNCGAVNGSYSGLAALSDAVIANDTLLFSLEGTGNTALIAGVITRT